MFDITLPGTGGMMPLPNRFLTGLFVSKDGYSLLIDCGEGMQVALSKALCKTSRLDTILITHIHADHCAGLPGLLLSLGNYGKTSPLLIYCPEKSSYTLKNLLSICPEIRFEVNFIELSSREISEFYWHDVKINSLPLRHGIKCLGYSLIENRNPVFNPQKAKKLNIPVKLWKKLHNGESINIDGKAYTQNDVCDEERKPLKITYVTDTLYFDGIGKFAENSDLLICEGMYGSDDYLDKMKEKHHMVFSQAANIAKISNSHELWLTHYSPALNNPDDYEKSVKSIFENTLISFDGMKKTLK